MVNDTKVLSDDEIRRVAMRVALTAWSELAEDSKTMNDGALLRKYILLCPFVSPNSSAVRRALQGLEDADGQNLPQLVIEDRDVLSDQSEDESRPNNLHASDSSSPSQIVHPPSASKARSLSVMDESSPAPRQQPPAKSKRVFGTILRSIIFDIPMFLVFASYLSLEWLDHIHSEYLTPQLEAVLWTDERAEDEITYYQRACHVEDLSTTNPNDLFLPHDVSADVAYHHQLKHGFSIFPSALSHDGSKELRDFVISRNRNLTETESIFVIENTNRYSFGLDTGEPAVAKAMKELANHEPLHAALEKIMGPAPALIEMTAITSSYGAVAQHWHDDVVSEASPVQYARTFGPSYSIFVQLQDTTTEMGATSACPGSHMCAMGLMSEFCESDGFQLVSDEGYWRTGDALLMNMDSWHRGAAHTDPDAEDRVMLILTFVPKPQPRAESRQMAQGITFSLRWDHWGLTWRDLRAGRFAFPWMRSLSIFKPSSAVWGLDYISSSSMRMANHDNGFRRDNLDTFIERDGGIWYLPKFLHGWVENENDSWNEYLIRTLWTVKKFLMKCSAISVGCYLLLFALMNVRSAPHKGLGRAMRRVTYSHGFAGIIYLFATLHVDNTNWACDIKRNLRYSNAFVEEDYHYPQETLVEAPTTFPDRRDVLVATRYSSEFLHMYNDWFDNHPGNSLFNKLVDDVAVPYQHYTDEFRDATVEYILGAIWTERGRFLRQSPHGTWRLMSEKDEVVYTKTEIHFKANPFLAKLGRAIDFIMSDYKYGIHRSTVLAKKISLSRLQDLQDKLTTPGSLKSAGPVKAIPAVRKVTFVPLRSFTLEPAQTEAKRWLREVPVGLAESPTPPSATAWLKAGDLVEGVYTDDNRQFYYYLGYLTHITASGNYHIEFLDGETDVIRISKLRRYVSHQIGEELEVIYHNQYASCKIINLNWEDGSMDVELMDSRVILQKVHPGLLRRARMGVTRYL